MFFCFLFSSRRRHTRCALVTGVQTCALPIYVSIPIFNGFYTRSKVEQAKLQLKKTENQLESMKIWIDNEVTNARNNFNSAIASMNFQRSEERRVGQACVSKCRSWWVAYHSKTKTCKKNQGIIHRKSTI